MRQEFQRRTSHTRSKSWDGSTSSSSVCWGTQLDGEATAMAFRALIMAVRFIWLNSGSGTGDSENEHYYGANVQSRQELHHWVVQTPVTQP